jgi:formamidopyrimidine-DNA glycosylase
MPELPEITSRACELQSFLPGKQFSNFAIIQPKSLNIPPQDFSAALVGASVLQVTNRGKWIFIHTDRGYLLLNLGMGGEITRCTPQTLPTKHRFIIFLSNGEVLSINFWWFGYIHFVPEGQLANHALTSSLGPNALELSVDEFLKIITGQRGRIKTYLLDQKNLAGIGNAYIHDILFLARLHPLRLVSSLSQFELINLYAAIHQGLQPALDLGGAFYEQTIDGKPGGFGMEHILIGYQEGKPCPNCSTPIQKIKTGSTTSFICPTCQPLE